MKKILIVLVLILPIIGQRAASTNTIAQTNLDRAALVITFASNYFVTNTFFSTNTGVRVTNRGTNFCLSCALQDPIFMARLFDLLATGLTNR